MPTNVDPDDPNADPVTYTQYFDICDEYEDAYGEETRGLAPSDKAVSAVATIVVNDGENYTSFASKCENIDEDNPYTLDVDESLTPEDEDGIDQSNFDIGTGSDQYPVVCSIWQ